MNELLAIVTARGGSKRLPGKNKKMFFGKPLIVWTIEAAQLASSVTDVIVSTDDKEIAQIAANAGARVPFLRSANLAADDTSSADVVIDVIERCDVGSDFVLLQPTSPLRTSLQIDEAATLHFKSKFESTVSIGLGAPSDTSFWWEPGTHKIFSKSHNTHHAGFRNVDTNGAVYWVRTERMLSQRRFVFANTGGYLMDNKSSVDIDTKKDWDDAVCHFQGEI